MYQELVSKVAGMARGKADLSDRSLSRYMLLSMMAGIFVGLGIILIFTIGGVMGDSPAKKIVMGASFGIALSLVLVIGSELFTGNNMIMTIGWMEKKVTWQKVLKIWVLSYVGNLLGSLFIAWLYSQTGLAKGAVADFYQAVSAGKMNAPFMALFVRGIFCNLLVCLAVMSFIKLKEETAKLLMIWWCLFAFITSGFEHSVANMTLMAVALFIPHGVDVTWAGYAANLIPVTLGNIVGGGLLLGAVYGYIGKNK